MSIQFDDFVVVGQCFGNQLPKSCEINSNGLTKLLKQEEKV